MDITKLAHMVLDDVEDEIVKYDSLYNEQQFDDIVAAHVFVIAPTGDDYSEIITILRSNPEILGLPFRSSHSDLAGTLAEVIRRYLYTNAVDTNRYDDLKDKALNG